MADSTASRFTFRRILLNLYIILTGAYGLNISAFLLLRALVGESWKIVALFNSYLHLLLMPSLLLLPLTLLMRRPRLALLQLPPLMLFIASYGGMFLPRTPPTAPEKFIFTLLSYNLHKDNSTPDDVISIIRESNPDIIAFQELNPVIANAFDAQLADEYPYRAFHADVSYPGQGIMSRYPITADEYWKIHLGHQRAQIDVNGTPLVLYNTHPVHPFIRERGFFDASLRAEEINDLLSRANAETLPVLIAGDFNMTDQTGDYQHIAQNFGDTYRETGWGMGFTFPDLGQGILLARLDYVFHSNHFRALEARVWSSAAGSDHRPILVRLALGADG